MERNGFALPAAILALVMVGLLVTGGFYLANQESRISHSGEQGTMAFYTAEQGLGEVRSAWSAGFQSLPQWGSAEVEGTTSNGEWSVRVSRIGDNLFLLESEGEITSGGIYGGARRQVAQVVRTNVEHLQDIEVPSALMTRGAVRLAGSTRIDGHDANPAGWDDHCPAPGAPRPGVITDDEDGVELDGGATIDGEPPIEEEDLEEEDFTEFGDFDWDDLVASANHSLPGGSINNTEPTVVEGECDGSDPYNWGDPLDPDAPCGNYFPIIHLQGDANIQSAGYGQGILLVDGDLDLRGSFTFYGIILVQGSFGTQGGGPRVRGGVMAANADLENQSYVGSSVVQNSSCAQQRALQNSSLIWASPLAQRSWVDLSSAMY